MTRWDQLPPPPDGWDIRPLKRAARINRATLPDATRDDFEFRYIDISSVQSDGRIDLGEPIVFEKAPSRARRIVATGDTVISTVRTYLKAIGRITEEQEGAIASTGFAVLTPRPDIDSEYLWRFVQSDEFVRLVQANSIGIGYPSIASSELGALPIFVPPLDAQRAIASFLDRETARIDTLIEKKRRLLHLLEEKRTALITGAVIRGLDPEVSMKDSGVEWIGEIPEHWKVASLGRVTASRCDGPFGSSLKSEHYVQQGIRVIRLQNIGSAAFNDADKAFIDSGYYATLGDHSVMPNDLLIAGLGDDKHPAGRACLAPDSLGPAMVKADCFRYRIKRQLAEPAYLAFLLSVTAPAASAALSSGATRSRLNLSKTSARSITLPPLDEQRRILKHVDLALQQSAALTAKLKGAITLLREYRTTLISGAVTGGFDVVSVNSEARSAKQRRAAKPTFARALMAAEIVQGLQNQRRFGRVKLMKLMYLVEQETGEQHVTGQYYRKAAGPLDNRGIRSVERILRQNEWVQAEKAASGRVEYRPMAGAGGHRKYLDSFWSDKRQHLSRVLELLSGATTEQTEIVATLYAAWNDLLIEGTGADDEQIIAEVLENWHEAKVRISLERWRNALDWMKQHQLVPSGSGRHTARV